MIHFCVATNQRPLKRQGLYCYLDLKVAIGDLGLKVMCSKTAEIVLVEDRVPPEAFCITWREPSDLGSMCLPNQDDLIKPRGRDAAQAPIKKRAKRTEDQQRLHDAMLSAIFRSVFEDTVPDSAVGIFSSGEKDRMGCDIPKVIEFRSLPVVVQDDLMRAEILPTMWPRYRISGHERMFHYCLMTVTRRQMLKEAECHSLSDIGIENMYPSVTDKKHRGWINSLMSTPGGHQMLLIS